MRRAVPFNTSRTKQRRDNFLVYLAVPGVAGYVPKEVNQRPGGARAPGADGAGEFRRGLITSKGRATASIARPLAASLQSHRKGCSEDRLIQCSTTVASASPGFQVTVPCSKVVCLPPSAVSVSSLVG